MVKAIYFTTTKEVKKFENREDAIAWIVSQNNILLIDIIDAE